MEGFQDGSGLFGVAGQVGSAEVVVRGLRGLVHRGGQGAALAVSDGTSLRGVRSSGVLQSDLGAGLNGDRAIGQVFGGLGVPGASGLPLDGGDRMVLGHGHHGALAACLAGRFTNGSRLRRELKAGGALFQNDSDAEVLLHLVAQSTKGTRVNRLVDALWKVDGAFSALVLGADVLVAVRDPRGFRPLYLGDLAGALVVATEEAAIRDVGGRVHRELAPGEMLIAHREGVDSLRPFPPVPSFKCTQELVTLARSDAEVFERSVHGSRVALGERLGLDAPAPGADVVVALPGDEPFGLGYASKANLPFVHGIEALHLGHWVAVGPVVQARRVVVVSRSLLTGTALKRGVALLRDAGAIEVHVRVASPPVQKACSYGVPSPTSAELAWTNRPDPEELALWMDATTVQFQAIQGLIGVLGADAWCQACMSGEQPVVPEEPDDQLPLF